MNRKAQVTMFIILGLLIVLAASLYFFSKQEDIKILPKQTVPEEISPIKRFVEECVYESGFTGLQNIGDTGGYIEYPIEILNNPRSYLKPIPVFPEIKKPYWWRDGKEIITSIPVMENQLEKFVAKDFVDCLNDFEDFKEQYEIEVLGEPTVEASINEEDVSFTLKYPINVKNKVFNKETKVKKYFTKVPVRLKPMFNLAKEIMDKENEGYFMEDFTIDLIALTPEEQIPYTGMDFKCGSKVWSGSVVQKRLKELLRFNIPLIRVNNTDYEPVPEDTPYVANHYIWYVTPDKRDFRVSLTYDEEWPFAMTARPNNGAKKMEAMLLKSNAQKSQSFLSFLCINLWHFTYDVKYPVMVTIVDEASAKHEAYSFSFPFFVSVDHNMPRREAFVSTELQLEQHASSKEFCEKTKEKQITVVTKNKYNDDPISKVNITYICGKYACDMGRTSWSEAEGVYGAEAQLVAKFPYCINGIIRTSKDGYLSSDTFVSTDDDKIVDVVLTPAKVFTDFKVVKHNKDDPGFEEGLGNDEKALISITQKEEDVDNFVIYPKEQEVVNEITLLKDGNFKYDVNIYLIRDETVVGGYEGEWRPDPEEIKNSEEIKLHIIYTTGFITEFEQYDFIGNLQQYSKKVPAPELR